MYNDRILSQPLDIYFAGFKANTVQLQQSGWDISAHESIQDMTMQLAFRNSKLQMYAVSDRISFDYYQNRQNFNYHITVALHVHNIARDIIYSFASTSGLESFNFHQINAFPEMINRADKSIEDLNFFSKAPREVIVKPEKEIIIPEQDLDGLLDQILGKYENTNREYHTKVTQAQQPKKVAAQIITLAR